MANWPRLTDRQREFVREITVIVLGVLIALGINEFADWLRWKYRVSETNARIAAQMTGDQAKFTTMIGWAGCANAALTDLDAVLIDARSSGRLPDISVIEPPAFGALTDATWETTIGNDVASHMNDDTAEHYARYYAAIKKLSDEEWRLAQQWARLNPLFHAPGPISADRADALRSAIAELQLVLQARSFTLHQALTEIQTETAVDETAKPRPCRPLMIDLKPYTRKAAADGSTATAPSK